MYCKTGYRLRKKIAYINTIESYLGLLEGEMFFRDVDDLLEFLEEAKNMAVSWEEYADAHGIGLGIRMINRCLKK